MSGDPAPVLELRWGSWRVVVERSVWPSDALTTVYDRLARRWRGLRGRFGFDEAYADLLAGVVAPRSPVVVDLGCGDGGLSRAWGRVHGPPAALHLVDRSSGMLTVASDAARANAVWVHPADVRSVPVAAGVADVVLMGHVLEHLPDPAPMLCEVRRLLADDGVAVLIVTRDGWWARWLQLRWRIRRLSDPEIRRAAEAAGLHAARRALSCGLTDRLSVAWVLTPRGSAVGGPCPGGG